LIKYQSEGIRKGEPLQHREARRQVELYLLTKGRTIYDDIGYHYPPEFVREHKLGYKFAGHSYDIVTEKEIIEIDGMNTRHSKKSQIINDQIAEDYIRFAIEHNFMIQKHFYRLLQEEITDPQGRLLDPKDVADYLKEHLF